jgi:hypothetical protein
LLLVLLLALLLVLLLGSLLVLQQGLLLVLLLVLQLGSLLGWMMPVGRRRRWNSPSLPCLKLTQR